MLSLLTLGLDLLTSHLVCVVDGVRDDRADSLWIQQQGVLIKMRAHEIKLLLII